MDLAEPQLLWLLLAAPLAGVVAALAWRRRLRATAAWASRALWDRLLPTYRRRRLVASTLLVVTALAAAGLTLARPRWGLAEQQIERRGVDVVFVLDTSLSMIAADVVPNRLFVAQTLVRRLIERLPGHRFALVQAEGDGVVMVPLTLDAGAVDLLLDAVQPGSLPTPGTDLDPGIRRALELYPEGGDKHRTMVLLSDGENHGKPVAETLRELRDRGVVVHAIGVGTPEGSPLEVPGGMGGTPAYKRDEAGNVVVSRLHEEPLEELARETGGVYLRATSAGTSTEPIADRIAAMESRSFGSETVSALEERFQWPLAIAVLALLLHLAVPPFAPPTLPQDRPR